MVVLGKLTDSPAKVALTEWHDVIEALALDGEHESLSICVGWGCERAVGLSSLLAPGELYGLLGEERVTIDDEVAMVLEKTVENVDEVPGRLCHPQSAGIVNDSDDLDAPGLDVDDE